jgi:hypothetical protein
VLRCHGAKWHHAQAVLVVYNVEPTSCYAARVHIILTIDCLTYWHGLVKSKSISAEVYDVHDFESTLTASCNFLPRWRLGMPLIILCFQLKIQMNASMTLQTLKCDRGMHWLNFSNVAGGWWQEEHAWLFLVMVEHMCARTFRFPELLVRIR